MDKAIANMPDDFEIKGFLKSHRAEVKNMCITEYNEEETMALFKKEWQEEGRKALLVSLVCKKLKKIYKSYR